MNPRNTWLLVALAAGLFAFIYFYERHLKPPQPVALKVVHSLDPAGVTAVEVTPRGEFKIRVERTNGVWQLTRPIAYPVQNAAVERFLQALAQLNVQMHISSRQLQGRRNFSAEFGFDDPASVIVLEHEGDPITLKLGLPTAPGDQVYAQLVGADGVEVVDAGFLKFVPRKTDDWRDPTFVNLAGVAFDGIVVASGAKSVLEFQRDPATTLWRMVRPDQTRADRARINSLLADLQMLRVEGFASDDPNADLDRFGLKTPELELAFRQGTNQLFALQFGKSPVNNSNLVYARSNGQFSIVLLPRKLVEDWRGESESFRERHLVNFVTSVIIPDTVEFSTPDGRDDFIVQGGTNGYWRVTDSRKQSYPADTQALTEFFGALASLEAVQTNGRVAYKGVVNETDWGPIYELTPPSRRYLVKRSAITNGTNLPAVVVAQLDFGLKDGRVFARRSDVTFENAVYEINSNDLARLPARAMDLRDRHIWNFDPTNVTNLVIQMNGKTWQYTHIGPGRWSIPVGTTGFTDSQKELQMEAALGVLNDLRADRWVDHGETARVNYGLTNNAPRISVGVKAGEQTRTLAIDFGNVSPRKLLYAAVQQDGETWIFEFPGPELKQLVDWLDLENRR